MAKITGLDIPIEFDAGFAKLVKLNWQGTQQRATITTPTPGRIKGSWLAGHSRIPDFLDDWKALTEIQQTLWLKNWGSGGEQAFALFFQNNYYRQLNALALRTTPNFFTAPAGWLHIAAGDTSVILRFDITSGDYILSDQANILHLQNRTLCEFGKAYSISATISAKLKNIATPTTAQCEATITQYYHDNEGNKSRQTVITHCDLNAAFFEYEINHTFTQEDLSEIVTGFRIDFEFSNAVGDIWFYESSVSAIDDDLGAVRLHNVINFQDVEKVFSNHLEGIKNQWSLNGEGTGTTLRRVFPYAFGYPEEGENPELITNGGFDGESPWDVRQNMSIHDSAAWFLASSQRLDMLAQDIEIVEGKTYTIKFKAYVWDNQIGYLTISLYDASYRLYLNTLTQNEWNDVEFDLFFEYTDEDWSIVFGCSSLFSSDGPEGVALKIDDVSVKEKSV